MRAIDDVIHFLENRKNLLVGAGSKQEFEHDAIEYLKAYRDIEDEYHELKDWWAEEYITNEPLTWDELKQMVGKPVWFVYDWNKVHYKGWILLDHMEGIFIVDAKDNWALCEVNMDKWQAYRKERK